MFIQLTPAQIKAMMRAIKNKTGYQLRLTKKQVASASETEFEIFNDDGSPSSLKPFPIQLLKRQTQLLAKAKEQNKPVVISFSASQMSRKSGGIFPLLMAAIPGLLGAAKPIANGFVDGFRNLGKLLGIKGASLETFASDVFPNQTGQSLKIFGEGFVSDDKSTGSSLSIQGQALPQEAVSVSELKKKRNSRKPKPSEITY